MLPSLCGVAEVARGLRQWIYERLFLTYAASCRYPEVQYMPEDDHYAVPKEKNERAQKRIGQARAPGGVALVDARHHQEDNPHNTKRHLLSGFSNVTAGRPADPALLVT